jgi:type IV secretory pathway TraG/TraD family ATPase VirD4
MIYGAEGTQALFTGLATQVVYGGCDVDTADFYSTASGTATQGGTSDDKYIRSRPLLTVDEVITPQIGNCTIFARYADAGYATQVVLNARLTRMYESEDWTRRLKSSAATLPLVLERGFAHVLPPLTEREKEEMQIKQTVASVAAEASDAGEPQSAVNLTSLAAMREIHEERITQREVES